MSGSTGGAFGDGAYGQSEDALTDDVLRRWADTVVPLAAPEFGFERVLVRAHRRKVRRRMLTATASTLSLALTVGGLAAAGVLPGVGAGGANCSGGGGSGNGTGLVGGAAGACGVTVAGGTPTFGARTSAPTAGPTVMGTAGTAPATTSVVTPSAKSVPVPTVSGTSALVPKCVTGGMSVEVDVVDGSQGMGHESLNVAVTNLGKHACTVYGYPGLQLMAQNLKSQPTAVTRDHAITAAVITLAPGGQAATTVRFGMDIPVGNEPTTGACEPASFYLAVMAPDSTTSLDAWINDSQPTPAGVTVCEHGALDVLPFVPGAVGPNQ